VQRALDIYGEAYRTHYQVGQNAMCALLDALISSGRSDEALAIWRSASKRGLRVHKRPLLRRLLAAAGKPRQSRVNPWLLTQLYEQRLYGEGVGPELEMIRAHGSRGALSMAMDVYHKAFASSPQPLLPQSSRRQCKLEQTQLLNEALAACARCRSAATALLLLSDADERHPEVPDDVSINTVVHCCRLEGRLRAAFDVLKKGAAKGLANAMGIVALLKGCVDNCDAALALQVYQWAQIERLLQQAPETHQKQAMQHLIGAIVPDAHQQTAHSVQLLEELTHLYLNSFEDDASEPFVYWRLGRALVVAFIRSGQLSTALSLIKTARQRGELLAPSSGHETELIAAIVDRGRLKEFASVLDEFRSQRRLPRWPVHTISPRRSSCASSVNKILKPEPDEALLALQCNVIWNASRNLAISQGRRATADWVRHPLRLGSPSCAIASSHWRKHSNPRRGVGVG